MEIFFGIAGVLVAFILFTVLRNSKALYGIKEDLYKVYGGISSECYKNTKARDIACDLVPYAQRIIDSERVGRVTLVKHAHQTTTLSAAQILYAEALKRYIQANSRVIANSEDLQDTYAFILDCFDEYLRRRAEGIKSSVIIEDLKNVLFSCICRY